MSKLPLFIPQVPMAEERAAVDGVGQYDLHNPRPWLHEHLLTAV